MKIPRILFLLKKNLIYGSYSSVIAKSGLLNSARITSKQLEKHIGVKTDLEICVDGNEIDKFIHRHRPNIVIIEAIWVTPGKLQELTRLHKHVLFIILCHSEIPFLAQEGNAIKWIKEYNELERVYPAFNSKETFDQFTLLGIECFYLPNIYYDVDKGEVKKRGDILQIGCFGAIRPFKNQLMQAVAAIAFAEERDMTLHFNINSSRIEQVGESVLKNLKALFQGTGHKLVEWVWLEQHHFLELVSRMDLGMQVSFTESFNLVAAAFVQRHVPVVVSKTITWMPEIAQAEVDNIEDILSKMNHAYFYRQRMANKNTRYLNRYNKRAIEAWGDFLF